MVVHQKNSMQTNIAQWNAKKDHIFSYERVYLLTFEKKKTLDYIIMTETLPGWNAFEPRDAFLTHVHFASARSKLNLVRL